MGKSLLSEEMSVESLQSHQRVYLEAEYLRWFCEDGSDHVTLLMMAQELGTSTIFNIRGECAKLDNRCILSEYAGKDT